MDTENKVVVSRGENMKGAREEEGCRGLRGTNFQLQNICHKDVITDREYSQGYCNNFVARWSFIMYKSIRSACCMPEIELPW